MNNSPGIIILSINKYGDYRIMTQIKPKQEMLPTEVHSLKNLVSYQQGSVVSRSLLKKDSGNVTLFAFDKGEVLSEHTSPFDAMVYICDGEAEIKISGNIFSLKEGDMIIMPSSEPHALKAVTHFKMLLIMVKG